MAQQKYIVGSQGMKLRKRRKTNYASDHRAHQLSNHFRAPPLTLGMHRVGVH